MMRRNSRDYNFSVKKKMYGNDIEYVAIFDDFPNLIGAGDTPEEAIEEGMENLDAYINYCYENSIPVPEPTLFDYSDNEFSGKVTLRMSKALHQRATSIASSEGISLNSFLNEAIMDHILSVQQGAAFKLLEALDTINENVINFNYGGMLSTWELPYMEKYFKESQQKVKDNRPFITNEGVMVTPSSMRI